MVKGSYTTEYRQYDPRIGRWLSVDPLFQNFPWQSPYVAFDNNPIVYNDPKGLAANNKVEDENSNKTKRHANKWRKKEAKMKDKIGSDATESEVRNAMYEKYGNKDWASIAGNDDPTKGKSYILMGDWVDFVDGKTEPRKQVTSEDIYVREDEFGDLENMADGLPFGTVPISDGETVNVSVQRLNNRGGTDNVSLTQNGTEVQNNNETEVGNNTMYMSKDISSANGNTVNVVINPSDISRTTIRNPDGSAGKNKFSNPTFVVNVKRTTVLQVPKLPKPVYVVGGSNGRKDLHKQMKSDINNPDLGSPN